MLVDPESFALAPGVERLLPQEGLKTELFSCLVETNTPVCENAAAVLDELRRLRRLVAERRGARGTRRRRVGLASVLDPGGAADRRRAPVPEDGRGARCDREGPARLRSPCSRRHGELRCLSPHARRDPAVAAGIARALGELAVPRRRGDRRPLVAALAAAPAAPRRPAATAGDGGGLGGCGRRSRSRLHPHLVGRTAASAARDARGPDRRPGDVGRAGGGARRAGAGALRGAAGAGAASSLDAVEPAARELGTWELVESLREPPEALRQLEVGRRDGLEAVAADLVRRSAA